MITEQSIYTSTYRFSDNLIILIFRISRWKIPNTCRTTYYKLVHSINESHNPKQSKNPNPKLTFLIVSVYYCSIKCSFTCWFKFTLSINTNCCYCPNTCPNDYQNNKDRRQKHYMENFCYKIGRCFHNFNCNSYFIIINANKAEINNS